MSPLPLLQTYSPAKHYLDLSMMLNDDDMMLNDDDLKGSSKQQPSLQTGKIPGRRQEGGQA